MIEQIGEGYQRSDISDQEAKARIRQATHSWFLITDIRYRKTEAGNLRTRQSWFLIAGR
jgi:hypothetical protein